MNNLNTVQNLYHPYKITIIGNVQVIDSSEGKFVLKKENKDLFTLFSYLDSRGINVYPKLIRNFNEEDNLLEYIDGIIIPKEQYLEEMALELANIHKKTLYEKEISIDELNSLKDNIQNNITFLSNKYHILVKSLILHDFLHPKEYFFIRHYYKIEEALDYCQIKLEEWYNKIKTELKVRVSLLHNNLSLEHFIIGKEHNYFISWDDYKFDLPLLDIVNFYNNNVENFDVFLKKYLDSFPYTEEELSLLFLLLSLPDDINENDDFISIIKKINKVYDTEKLIRPYNLKDQKE